MIGSAEAYSGQNLIATLVMGTDKGHVEWHTACRKAGNEWHLLSGQSGEPGWQTLIDIFRTGDPREPRAFTVRIVCSDGQAAVFTSDPSVTEGALEKALDGNLTQLLASAASPSSDDAMAEAEAWPFQIRLQELVVEALALQA